MKQANHLHKLQCSNSDCIYLVKNHFATAPAVIICWQPAQNCTNQKSPNRLYHLVTYNKYAHNINQKAAIKYKIKQLSNAV